MMKIDSNRLNEIKINELGVGAHLALSVEPATLDLVGSSLLLGVELLKNKKSLINKTNI